MKVWVDTIAFPSLEFSEVCLTVEAKTTALSDVALNVCKGHV